MSHVAIDLTGVGEIPDGTYLATIQSYEIKDSKAGDKYVNWTLYAPELAMNIYYITSLKSTALFGIKKLLEVAGVTFGSDGFNLDDCISKQIMVTTVTEDSADYGRQSKIKKISKA